MQRAREQRKEGREGGWLNVGLGLENFLFILVLFLSGGLVEPVRFGSVQSVSDFENRNRTEPNFFVIFQSVNSVFFFGSVLLVVFFPVFSV